MKSSTSKVKSSVDSVNKEKRISSGVTQSEILPHKVHDIQKRSPDVIPIVTSTNIGTSQVDKIADVNTVPESKK